MALNKSENKRRDMSGKYQGRRVCSFRNLYMKWRIHLTARALLAFDN